MRTETRRERYNKKINVAQKYPISIATVNFMCDENLAYVVRSAGCFGLSDVHVIGSIPEYREMRKYSGTLNNYVVMHQYKNPHDFLVAMKNKGIKLVSLELCDGATNIEDYNFDFNQQICIVTGHETTGVPAEILAHSEKVFIPMDGVGYSLNTSQAANIAAYEAVKQYKRSSIGVRQASWRLTKEKINLLLVILFACFDKPKPQIEIDIIKEEVQVSEIAKNLDSEQQKVACVIEKNFDNMQIPKNITAAAIVNAVAESKLNPFAIGDNGKAVGVFQLHSSGLGHKISNDLKKDININSNVIAVQIIKNNKLLKTEQNGANISELTKIITKDIMRPSDVAEQMMIRSYLAKEMFPDRI